MIFSDSNFILQLCFDKHIPSYYHNIVVNTLSGHKIEGTHEQVKQGESTKISVLYDIPNYLEVTPLATKPVVDIKKVAMYEGYLIDLNKFKGVDELVSQTLSRNPRKNLISKHKKLELNHQIRYEYYYGHIDKNQYDDLFTVCYTLMEARFKQKKIFNRYLLDWSYYHKVFYPKILAKEASICVIYDQTKPITITLNFHQADIVFSFIQIYDVDYYKYSLGDIAMYKNIQWCYKNDFSIWDLSKGATDNKVRWSNHTYRFYCHLIFNRKSVVSKMLVNLQTQKLKIKQFLRDKGIIGGLFQLDRVYYYTNMKKLKNGKTFKL